MLVMTDASLTVFPPKRVHSALAFCIQYKGFHFLAEHIVSLHESIFASVCISDKDESNLNNISYKFD